MKGCVVSSNSSTVIACKGTHELIYTALLHVNITSIENENATAPEDIKMLNSAIKILPFPDRYLHYFNWYLCGLVSVPQLLTLILKQIFVRCSKLFTIINETISRFICLLVYVSETSAPTIRIFWRVLDHIRKFWNELIELWTTFSVHEEGQSSDRQVQIKTKPGSFAFEICF